MRRPATPEETDRFRERETRDQRLAHAVLAVRKAIEDEGRNPQHHRDTILRQRFEWPTLWRALDELLAATKAP